jgi:hypothetical protein
VYEREEFSLGSHVPECLRIKYENEAFSPSNCASTVAVYIPHLIGRAVHMEHIDLVVLLRLGEIQRAVRNTGHEGRGLEGGLAR